MQTPPALPQLINSAEDWLPTIALPASPPISSLTGGGQIQGSGAQDLPSVLPDLACQPRCLQQFGKSENWEGREVIHQEHYAPPLCGASHRNGTKIPSGPSLLFES